jgi:ComF family protein
LCQDCVAVPPAFTALRSTCIYRSGARKAVLRLKYGRDIGLGEALAAQMAAQISNLQWPVELVTCVPLSAGRRSQRGYNQAAALARPLALGMNLPFRPLLLRKKREVPSQVGLSFEERRLNVQDAFETGGSIQIGKNVLVVDDVTTTGSTMNACARALIDAGAQRVYGLTFARAGLSDHNQSEQARN